MNLVNLAVLRTLWSMWGACTPASDEECPDACGVAMTLVPPSAMSDVLIVRSEPDGVAFGGVLVGPDGAEIRSVQGLGETAFELNEPLALGATYELRLEHACEPGEAKPACASVTLRFAASDGVPGSTTAPDDGRVTDVREQVTVPLVDVLFVVDNSCSMADNQADLVEAAPNLFDYFHGSGVDWHLGVVSTDMDDPSHRGKLRDVSGDRWVNEDTADASAVFAAMVQMGTTGSGSEQGLGATFAALETEADDDNAGFLRDDSDLHVIVLSDERDQTPTSTISIPEFESWFRSLRDDGPTMSAIVTTSGPDRGTGYIDVAEMTGGVVWDITSGDYSSVMEILGLQASGLKREFSLSRVPVLDTLEVRVDIDEVTLLFELDEEYAYVPERNSVVFLEYVPEAGSVVTLSYEERP